MSSNKGKADVAIGQLPLEFGHQPSNAREDLIVSDPLNAALRIVDDWPDWPSAVVILAGPTGAGKTHLANIWKERSGATLVSLSTDSEKALLEAAAGAILVEDIDREGFDDTQLFHLINTVRQNGTSLLITTRIWPAAWPVYLPDLRSRLKAATVVEIGEPDDALLVQVIEKLFADRQVSVDPKVVSYLVQRMERSLDAAQMIVGRVDALALARRCKVSRGLAAEVLAELEASSYDTELS